MIESHETYQKKSTRNKCTILGAQGPLTLSIPLLKGKHSQSQITQVKISYHENWIKEHLRQIELCYIKAPYLIYYYDELADILHQEYQLLFDLNLHLLTWSLSKLKLDLDVSFTKSFIGSEQIPAQTALTYPQVYDNKHDFVKDLSILDLIMNTGPEATIYLKS